MSDNSNEPAFPFACQGPTTAPECYYGLTKRELIAAMAMQGFLGGEAPFKDVDWSDTATASVKAADALLRALEHAT